MDSMEDLTPQDLLRETAWLHGLARQLVADPDLAEDVAQDTWLALAMRGRVAELRPWLRRVAKNIAARRVVRESRRKEREERAARPEAQPSAAESVERVRLQHRVVAALLGLPEPYRSTVVLRFFEDLPPRKVAARMGVPVETVRTRLQRALTRMRKELDREFTERKAWAVPLASAFGLGRTAATTLLLGSIMKAKLLVPAAVLLVASGIGYLLVVPEPPPTVASAPEGVQTLAAASAEGPDVTGNALDIQDPGNADAREVQRTALRSGVPDSVTLTGRCVDAATGQPVAGISVELDVDGLGPGPGFPPGGYSYLIPPWPPTTDGDGRFCLDVKSGWYFALTLSGAGIVPMSTRSAPLELGTVDLGDVEVTRGCIVRGRLVDEDGQPLADQTVAVDNGGVRFDHRIMVEANEAEVFAALGQFPIPSRMAFEQVRKHRVITDAEGVFEVTDPVAPDMWTVHLWERRRLVRETTLEVREGELERWIDLVAERPVDVLSGVVVDDRGAPVPEARVYFELVDGTHWYLVAEEDGSFRTLRFARDPDGPVPARAVLDGYTSPGPVSCAWGSEVEVPLYRGGIVEVRVVEAADGTPLRNWMVRVIRVPEDGEDMADDILGADNGSGTARLSGVLPGRNLVRVEASGSGLEASMYVPVDVSPGQVSQVEVRLHAGVTRGLRLVDRDGHPVAGSSVQLLSSPVWGTVRAYTAASENRALVLAGGVTDLDGRLELRAAPAGDLWLRVFNMDHPPVVLSGIELAAGMPELVVEVKPGAVIAGVLEPMEDLRRYRPTLHLLNAEDPGYRLPWPDPAPYVQVSEDGAFRFTNVPEGSWTLVFDGRQAPESVLMTVEGLLAGEERNLTVDGSHLVPGRLRGRVLLDGAPGEGWVSVQTVPGGAGGLPMTYARARTDGAGAFTLQASPGRYRVIFESGPRSWKSEEVVEILPGEESEQELRFLSRRFVAVLLDPEGRPLAERAVEVLWKGDLWPWPPQTLQTDDRGELVVDPAPPGPFHLGLRPPGLVTNLAWNRHRQERGARAYEDLVRVGPLEASGGETVRVTVPDR